MEQSLSPSCLPSLHKNVQSSASGSHGNNFAQIGGQEASIVPYQCLGGGSLYSNLRFCHWRTSWVSYILFFLGSPYMMSHKQQGDDYLSALVLMCATSQSVQCFKLMGPSRTLAVSLHILFQYFQDFVNPHYLRGSKINYKTVVAKVLN